ncbi:hypothetical protein V3C99_014556 [Haemonchus contortus]|uniref:CsbD family protein n=1 Tax=Haemonchus contortus TaxID=6289 RepID=A0A7I4YVU0_HAECO|nr:unknown [Haemonchus contortus]
MSYNETTAMQPSEELRLVDGPTNRCGRYQEPDCTNKGQGFGSAAKEKLHDAGQAIKHTAENIGDKAGELKDKAMNKIQEGADAIKSH